jgi:hypothetical protein
MLLRIVLTATSISLSSLTAFAADAVGVPACDDFLTKYEACITSKVPAAQKDMMQNAVAEMRKGWLEAAKNPQLKPQLQSMCKTSADQMKATFSAYGCSM